MSSDEKRILTPAEMSKEIRKLNKRYIRLKDTVTVLEDRVEALEEKAEGFGLVEEKNKQMKKEIKDQKKELKDVQLLIKKFVPKDIPLTIDPLPMQEVQTPQRDFQLENDEIQQFRASDFVKQDFVSSHTFNRVCGDLTKFTVEAISEFLKKPVLSSIQWTVTTGGNAKSYKEFPSLFIQDVIFLGMIGAGFSNDRTQWGDERAQYNRALTAATLILQNRLNRRRSDRKRKHPGENNENALINDNETT